MNTEGVNHVAALQTSSKSIFAKKAAEEACALLECALTVTGHSISASLYAILLILLMDTIHLDPYLCCDLQSGQI